MESEIVIPDVGIDALNVPNIFVKSFTVNPPHIYVPVVVDIGKPIVDMPGCIEAHELNKTQAGGTKNKQLAKDDDTITICDAGMPSFNAMDYTPEQLIITRDIPPPKVEPPPEIDPPEVPPTGDLGTTETECPAPNQPRVGDLTANGEEKVVGHEVQGTTCVVLY